jgi:tetratricopeptide (TPR) repeat protein
VRALRVHVAEEIAIVVDGNADSRLGEHLMSVVQAELAKQGLAVVRGNEKPDLTVKIETRVKGALYFLRGHVALTAEKGHGVIATGGTEDELHRDNEFANVMAAKAVAELLHAPALAQFAAQQTPRRDVATAKPAPAAQPAATALVRPTTPAPAAVAKAHASRATGLYNLGHFKEALAEFEAAYMAIQDPPFLFNIAQCHRKMGDNKDALDSYRSYLRVAPNAPNRTEVQKRISELEREAHAAR